MRLNRLKDCRYIVLSEPSNGLVLLVSTGSLVKAMPALISAGLT